MANAKFPIEEIGTEKSKTVRTEARIEIHSMDRNTLRVIEDDQTGFFVARFVSLRLH